MTTETSAASFTRMDESTSEQWAVIGHETMAAQPDVAEHVLALLRNLDGMVHGFAVDQLTHCLQTATLAERAGADDELVVAVALPRHRQVRERRQSSGDRRRDAPAIRARGGVPRRSARTRTSRASTTTSTSAAIRTPREVPRRAVVRPRRGVRRRVGPDRVRPRLRLASPRAFRAQGARRPSRCPRTSSDSACSLKYYFGRHWMRSHATLVALAVIVLGIVVYLIARLAPSAPGGGQSSTSTLSSDCPCSTGLPAVQRGPRSGRRIPRGWLPLAPPDRRSRLPARPP